MYRVWQKCRRPAASLACSNVSYQICVSYQTKNVYTATLSCWQRIFRPKYYRGLNLILERKRTEVRLILFWVSLKLKWCLLEKRKGKPSQWRGLATWYWGQVVPSTGYSYATLLNKPLSRNTSRLPGIGALDTSSRIARRILKDSRACTSLRMPRKWTAGARNCSRMVRCDDYRWLRMNLTLCDRQSSGRTPEQIIR